MDDMILLELGAVQQISDNTSVVGNGNANGIFDCPHRGQIMGVRSDPARTLHKQGGIPGIPPLQDNFDAPEHLSGTPGVLYLAPFNFHFDSKMALYPRNWIDYNSFAHVVSSLFVRVFAFC